MREDMQPSSTLYVETLPCDESSDAKDCLFMVQMTQMMYTQHLVAFDVFQSLLVYTALLAGLVCLLYLCAVGPKGCKNWGLLFTTILTGFLHILFCIYILQIVQVSSNSFFGSLGAQDCTDYSLPATIANVIVLLAIALSVVSQWTHSRVEKLLVSGALVISMAFGLCLLSDRARVPDSTDPENNAFVTFGHKNSTQIDIFWSVCQRNISGESLLYEYLLIYSPFLVVVLGTWCASARKLKDASLMKVKIIRTPCMDDEDVHCFCRKLNLGFVAIFVYTALILFIARPIQIAYSYFTSGLLRDVLPSLLQSVMYCFLCSEIIYMFLRNRLNRKHGHRSQSEEPLKVAIDV